MQTSQCRTNKEQPNPIGQPIATSMVVQSEILQPNLFFPLIKKEQLPRPTNKTLFSGHKTSCGKGKLIGFFVTIKLNSQMLIPSKQLRS